MNQRHQRQGFARFCFRCKMADQMPIDGPRSKRLGLAPQLLRPRLGRAEPASAVNEAEARGAQNLYQFHRPLGRRTYLVTATERHRVGRADRYEDARIPRSAALPGATFFLQSCHGCRAIRRVFIRGVSLEDQAKLVAIRSPKIVSVSPSRTEFGPIENRSTDCDPAPSDWAGAARSDRIDEPLAFCRTATR